MQQVYSSNVREVGYDDEAKEMVVVFKNGRRYGYPDVSEAEAVQLANAPSVGSLFNAEYKTRQFRRL